MPTTADVRTAARDRRASARRALALAALLAAAAGCGREPTGPWGGGARLSRGIAFRPVFPAAYTQSVSSHIGSLVPFNKVRVLFRRTLGEAALDTVVVFPADADSMAVSFSLRLAPNAPDDGEPLALSLAYVNEAGDTVLRGGPVSVLAQVASADHPPLVVSVPVVYTGPGANAKSVRIAFRSLGVTSGDAIRLDAVALDSADHVIPNTPVLWQSEDTSLVWLSDAGGGDVRGVRGAVGVVARLLTGPADTSALLIQPVPTGLQVVSGDGQAGDPLSTLPQQVLVRAIAADGLPVAGAAVAFAAANGGSASPAAATANSSGVAATAWRLGGAAGTQTLTASLVVRPAVAIDMHATARAATVLPGRLAFTAQPRDAEQGKSLVPQVVVEARDASGALDKSFSGPVTLQLAPNASGLALDGTTTVSAVAGVATFGAVSVGKPGTGLRLVAAAPALVADTSVSFAILASSVIITPSSVRLVVFSGDAQSGLVGEPLAKPLAVAVLDDHGKPVKGVAVSWTVPATGGALTNVKSETDDSGIATAVWTLGTLAGPQAVSASIGSSGAATTAGGTLVSSAVTFRATALAGDAAKLVFTGQPATSIAGETIGAIVVVARDRYDNLATSFSGVVTLEAAGQAGGIGLSGSTSIAAVSGVASFGKVFLTRAGPGVVLVAKASGPASQATSVPFEVRPAAPASLLLAAGDNQNAKLGSALSNLLAVRVTDAFGNGISGVVVSWRVTLGLGTLASSSSVTNAYGLATNSLTLLGLLRGLQQVTATTSVLPGQGVVFSATGN